MSVQHVTMAANGRLVVPAGLRSELGMERGGAFVATVENGSIRLVPLRDVVASVQAEVRRYVPAGSDLAGELERDRRAEAADE